MGKEDVIEYVMNSPENTNRAALASILDNSNSDNEEAGLKHLLDGVEQGSLRASMAAKDTEDYKLNANAVAFGYGTEASGYSSFAEGYETKAIKQAAHAEGYGTIANGQYSHAEGYYAIAKQDYSHAEGYHTLAGGYYAHAEGQGDGDEIWSQESNYHQDYDLENYKFAAISEKYLPARRATILIAKIIKLVL